MKLLKKIGSGMFVLSSLAACGGGGGGSDGGGGGGGTTNNAPTADAGTDFMISRNTTATLDGTASSDPDGDTLTYTWTQLEGPDVTAGTGTLDGDMPSFTAPETVDTLVFDISVSDGNGGTSSDTVSVNVLENVDAALFVDGFNGNDTTGDGSMESPYASIVEAIANVTSSEEDVYVVTLPLDDNYDESSSDIRPESGTSLYGGYNEEWNRDIETNKTPVVTNNSGVLYGSVEDETWVSGFDLQVTGSSSAGSSVYGIFATGSNSVPLHIHDNIITTGDVAAGESSSPGSNYGLALRQHASVDVYNNTITVGQAGSGSDGATGATGADGDDGTDGNRTGGRRASGGSGGSGANGGAGGTRGGGPGGNGGGGSDGGNGSDPLNGTTIAGGDGGSGGSGGGNPGSNGTDGDAAGRGIPGAAGVGSGVLTSSLFVTGDGIVGGRGGHGAGGGGGGGGEANTVGVVGGGGGGGGEGGSGGYGGTPGSGGGASIGIWLHDIDISNVDSNTIVASNGGNGGQGGSGGLGGDGGDRGVRALGDDNFAGNGASGGSGGLGGDGGRAGYGGSGAGGPSYGITFGTNMSPIITNNSIISGDGGAGGDSFTRGNSGEGGFSIAIYDRDRTDDATPTLSNNTLSFGSAGMGGSGGGTDGAVLGADNGIASDTNF